MAFAKGKEELFENIFVKPTECELRINKEAQNGIAVEIGL